MCYLTSGAVIWMLQLHFRAEVVTLFYGPLHDILRHSTCRLFLKMYAEYPDVFSMYVDFSSCLQTKCVTKLSLC